MTNYEDFPKEIQTWLSSDEFINKEVSIGYSFGILGSAIGRVIFLLCSKNILPQDFGKELAKRISGSDIAKTNSLLQNIREQLLEPIRSPFSDFGIDIDQINQIAPEDLKGPAEEAGTAPVATDEPKNLKPAFNSKSTPATPFVLHEEESREVASGLPGTKPSLSRPSFYKPGFSQYSDNYPEKPQAVKLELGEEKEVVPSGPATIKVGQEEARVVHYSEMRTPLDPFTKTTQEPDTLEAPKKKDVHPDNIINLKDLPL